MAEPYVVPDDQAKTLALNNILKVFGNRDDASRKAAIKETYHPDVIVYETDEVVHGHDGLNAKAEELLDKFPGFRFEPRGNIIKNHGMMYLSWGFGPEGKDGKVDPKVMGGDVLIVEDGLVKKLWVVIEGVTEVKL